MHGKALPTPSVGWHELLMLQGKELGQAIKRALSLKGMSQAALARKFHVEPPSVAGWIKFGRIEKGKLWRLMDMFSDVVGPEHWGLPSTATGQRRKPTAGVPVLDAKDPAVVRNLTQNQRTFGQLVDSVLPLLNPAQLDAMTRMLVEFVGRNVSAAHEPTPELEFTKGGK